jgi:hypothetical protein
VLTSTVMDAARATHATASLTLFITPSIDLDSP